MANQDHFQMLSYGEVAWNRWRESNPALVPDLTNTDLRGITLSGINLRNANLAGVKLTGTDLSFADLHGADLTSAELTETTLCEADLCTANLHKADLTDANLIGADISRAELKNACFSGADLSFCNLSFSKLSNCNLIKTNLYRTLLNVATLDNADLTEASLHASNFSGASLRSAVLTNVSASGCCLTGTDLKGADLTGADLSQCNLFGANLCGAILTGCRVFAADIWEFLSNGDTRQDNLIITPENQLSITVDSLKSAGFIQLYLSNAALRSMFTVKSNKTLLIIGSIVHRRTELAAAAEVARSNEYIPIVFDASPKAIDPVSLEKLAVLAGICSCVIIDITEPQTGVVRQTGKLPFSDIPVVPIAEAGRKIHPVFSGLTGYSHLHKTVEYQNAVQLKERLGTAIIQAVSLTK